MTRATPNKGLELTASSVRSSRAPASGSSSGPAFGPATWRDMQLGPLFFEAGAEAAEVQLPRLAALARPCRVPA